MHASTPGFALCMQPTYKNLAKFIQVHTGTHQSFTQRGLASGPVSQTPAMTIAEVGGSMHKYFSRFQATSAFANSPIYNLIIGTNSVLGLLSCLSFF